MVLINAIKDVAKALSDLIGATKGAASKPADDPSMYQLKGAAKVRVGCKQESLPGQCGVRESHMRMLGEHASELLSHNRGVFACGIWSGTKRRRESTSVYYLLTLFLECR